MSIRSDWVTYRTANLAAFQARHRGSRFAGTARNNAWTGHPAQQPGTQGSKFGTQPPTA